jgi:excisionase family DNA binding protein
MPVGVPCTWNIPRMEDRLEDEPRFLRIPEVAQLLRINRGRVYSMAADGTLPGVIRLGRTIRIDRVRLLEELAKAQQSEDHWS